MYIFHKMYFILPLSSFYSFHVNRGNKGCFRLRTNVQNYFSQTIKTRLIFWIWTKMFPFKNLNNISLKIPILVAFMFEEYTGSFVQIWVQKWIENLGHDCTLLLFILNQIAYNSYKILFFQRRCKWPCEHGIQYIYTVYCTKGTPYSLQHTINC